MITIGKCKKKSPARTSRFRRSRKHHTVVGVWGRAGRGGRRSVGCRRAAATLALQQLLLLLRYARRRRRRTVTQRPPSAL